MTPVTIRAFHTPSALMPKWEQACLYTSYEAYERVYLFMLIEFQRMLGRIDTTIEAQLKDSK